LTFGPVPSRRLGRSLGINNIPPKSCTYSCRYCQVEPTHETEVVPRPFYSPDNIFKAVKQRLTQAKEAGEAVDYLTFFPDGEPTLDSRLKDRKVALIVSWVSVGIVQLLAEQQLEDTKIKIRDTKRRSRSAQTMDEQKEYQEEIKTLEKQQRRQRQAIFDVEDEIEARRDALIEALERRMHQNSTTHHLFRIH